MSKKLHTLYIRSCGNAWRMVQQSTAREYIECSMNSYERQGYDTKLETVSLISRH